jgi:hypothetical protein
VKLTPFVKTHSISVYSGCRLQQIAPAGLQGYISASLLTNSKLQSYCQYTSKTIKEGFPNVLESWKTTYHVKKKTKTPPFPVSATGKDCIIVGPSQNSHLVVHFRSEIFLPTSKVAMCHNQYLLGS